MVQCCEGIVSNRSSNIRGMKNRSDMKEGRAGERESKINAGNTRE